jgi:hypothetical protein
MWRRRSWTLALLVLFLSGCTHVAAVTTLDDDACGALFEERLGDVLMQQGEAATEAASLAARARLELADYVSPRPFLISSRSGVDYGFFIQKKGAACFLRLFERQKGFTRYTNNLTYIATRPLPACQCE